jgi:diguanylate cyclase (GGDEF)-like protein
MKSDTAHDVAALSEQRETNSGKRDDAANRRDVSSERRDAKSELRDKAADARDVVAADRDEAAELGDRNADDRDSAAARTRSVESTKESLPEASIRQHSAADRKRSADDRDDAEVEREKSADDRDDAKANRSASMTERGKSASDRGSSAQDRRVSAQQSANAAMDSLTGAYLRGPGIAELQREMERSVRTTSPLTLAFVDVDSLKTVNDSRGHAAGDRLLIAVVKALGERLRPYDRIVRYGGDEFLCVLSHIAESDAVKRFADVNESLSLQPDSGSVTVGLAMMKDGDSVASFVERADRALYLKRGR